MHGIEDFEAVIEEEKIATHEKLSRLSDTLRQDEAFFKEIFLRAQRAYTGQHMKAVYTDQRSGQFFNVENLALKYYGQKEGWNGLHVENMLMRHYLGVLLWDEIFYDRVPYVF